MKALFVPAMNEAPTYGEFESPVAKPGEDLITVRAAALSNLTRSRASGQHYSAANVFPAVVGVDGVGTTPDGRRVYFAMPEPPFGSFAELCPAHPRRCVEIPDSLDDITAAAIANPGMSVWAALVERAQLLKGETVLINGATGTAGKLAVQLAKYLGSGKVIATGRNHAELEALKELGADVVLPFSLDPANPAGRTDFENACAESLAAGIEVVLDYLWGESASAIIAAIARTVGDKPVRFVQVGGSSGESTIPLPSSALRSSALTLMGSGIGSVSRSALVGSIRSVFEAVGPAGLKVDTEALPLSQAPEVWSRATGKPRLVFTVS